MIELLDKVVLLPYEGKLICIPKQDFIVEKRKPTKPIKYIDSLD